MIEVPDTDCPFAVGALVLHPEEGLSIVNDPIEVS